MLNFYDYVSKSNSYRAFKVDDLLFVEYKCLIAGDRTAFWTHNNYFAYILSGTRQYACSEHTYTVGPGDAMFVRRGSYLSRLEGNSPDDYCALIIFVPDEFIRSVSEKYPARATGGRPGHGVQESGAILRLKMDQTLNGYFQSVLSYFPMPTAPSADLLKVKFEELLLNILTSESNPSAAAQLRSIGRGGKISLPEVMERSFMFPMSLEEYARLCARSLTAFKADFQKTYSMSPGKWLKQRRIRYARFLIESTSDSVNEIAFKSGFKNTAHFVRVFKDEYGVPPLQYRLRGEAVPA